jgi:hypothetical protein
VSGVDTRAVWSGRIRTGLRRVGCESGRVHLAGAIFRRQSKLHPREET